MSSHIIIFTDGSSSGNPGKGGWAAIVAYAEKVREFGGAHEHTTNNRMEMTAVIEALLQIGDEPGDAVIHTDSKYVIQGITTWVKGWMQRDWRTSTGGDVLNRDLWEQLVAVVAHRKTIGKVTWKHIKGHAGIPGNERVDEIATSFTHGSAVELYKGTASEYTVDLSEKEARTDVDDDAAADKKAGADAKKKRRTGKAYSYVSFVHGEIMTHQTWAECEARVKGARAAKFKKAMSAEDEKNIIHEFTH